MKSPAIKNKLRSELIDIEKKLQNSYKATKAYEEHKAIMSIKNNAKYFFAYAKRFSKQKSSIGPLIDDTGAIISDNLGMANVLATQFSSAYSTPKSALPAAGEMFCDDFCSFENIPFIVVNSVA